VSIRVRSDTLSPLQPPDEHIKMQAPRCVCAQRNKRSVRENLLHTQRCGFARANIFTLKETEIDYEYTGYTTTR
jgi:hypothetical protein